MTWTLESGVDAGATSQPRGGELKFKTAPDFENAGGQRLRSDGESR